MKKVSFIFSLIFLFGTQTYSQDLYPYFDEASDKFGFMVSGKGEVAVSPKYDLIDGGTEGLFRVGIENGGDYLYGFVDAQTGEEVIPLIYTHTKEFSSGLVLVWKQDDTTFFVDKEGNEILGHLYEKYSNVDYQFGDGLLVVSGWGEGFGFINQNDEVIIPLKYDDAKRFSEGLAAVKQDDLYGFINTSDELIIPFKYTDAGIFCEGLAYVEMNGKFGYINKSGEEVIPLVYDEVTNFERGSAYVNKDGESFNIDTEGNVLDY